MCETTLLSRVSSARETVGNQSLPGIRAMDHTHLLQLHYGLKIRHWLTSGWEAGKYP